MGFCNICNETLVDAAKNCGNCGSSTTSVQLDKPQEIEKFRQILIDSFFELDSWHTPEGYLDGTLKLRKKLEISYNVAVNFYEELKGYLEEKSSLVDFTFEFNQNVFDAFAGHDTYLQFRVTNKSKTDAYKVYIHWDDIETEDAEDLHIRSQVLIKPNKKLEIGGTHIFQRTGPKEISELSITVTNQFKESAKFKVSPFRFNVKNPSQTVVNQITTKNEISIEGRGVVDAANMGSNVLNNEHTAPDWIPLEFFLDGQDTNFTPLEVEGLMTQEDDPEPNDLNDSSSAPVILSLSTDYIKEHFLSYKDSETDGEWLVTKMNYAVGDEISVGDVLFEVENNKVSVEITSPFSGKLFFWGYYISYSINTSHEALKVRSFDSSQQDFQIDCEINNVRFADFPKDKSITVTDLHLFEGAYFEKGDTLFNYFVDSKEDLKEFNSPFTGTISLTDLPISDTSLVFKSDFHVCEFFVTELDKEADEFIKSIPQANWDATIIEEGKFPGYWATPYDSISLKVNQSITHMLVSDSEQNGMKTTDTYPAVVFNSPRLLLMDFQIQKIHSYLPILEDLNNSDNSLVMVAKEFSKTFIDTIRVNILRGGLHKKIALIKISNSEVIKDISYVCGHPSQIYKSESEVEDDSLKLDSLPAVKQSVIHIVDNYVDFVIYNNSDGSLIDERITQVSLDSSNKHKERVDHLTYFLRDLINYQTIELQEKAAPPPEYSKTYNFGKSIGQYINSKEKTLKDISDKAQNLYKQTIDTKDQVTSFVSVVKKAINDRKSQEIARLNKLHKKEELESVAISGSVKDKNGLFGFQVPAIVSAIFNNAFYDNLPESDKHFFDYEWFDNKEVDLVSKIHSLGNGRQVISDVIRNAVLDNIPYTSDSHFYSPDERIIFVYFHPKKFAITASSFKELVVFTNKRFIHNNGSFINQFNLSELSSCKWLVERSLSVTIGKKKNSSNTSIIFDKASDESIAMYNKILCDYLLLKEQKTKT